MILCDDIPVCPTPHALHWQIQQRVDDSARPDPMPRKERPSRSRPAALPQGWKAGLWHRFPVSVERSARCIAKHESWNAEPSMWKAANPESSARGFAQWIKGTWEAHTQRAGVGEQYASADLAPPPVQAEVFAFQAMNFGLYPWHGTHCPGT